ncbi:hypothetical protein RCZ04_04080 [Capnocytophaga sp. HP1101]
MKKQLSKEREAVELFEYAARNLIKEFCDKQELQFEFDNYDVGIGIICLSDYFFNIEDIYFDMKHDKSKGKILQWYDYVLTHESNINYRSYCMGMREELITKKSKK